MLSAIVPKSLYYCFPLSEERESLPLIHRFRKLHQTNVLVKVVKVALLETDSSLFDDKDTIQLPLLLSYRHFVIVFVICMQVHEAARTRHFIVVCT